MAGYFEPEAGRGLDAAGIVTACIESGFRAVLLDGEGVLPGFFDLSSRVAGELLHKLSMYGIRLATVVPDPGAHSGPFQDLMREANRGRQYRFFPTRDDAIDWLQGA